MGGEWQIRTSTEKMEHCLIFTRELICFTIALCLNILWLKAVNEITARQTRTSLGKHEVIKLCSVAYLTTVYTNWISVANFQVPEHSQNYRIFNTGTAVHPLKYLSQYNTLLFWPPCIYSTFTTNQSQIATKKLKVPQDSANNRALWELFYLHRLYQSQTCAAMAPIMKVSIISILILYCNNAHFKNSLSSKPARKYTTQPNSVQWHTEIK